MLKPVRGATIVLVVLLAFVAHGRLRAQAAAQPTRPDTIARAVTCCPAQIEAYRAQDLTAPPPQGAILLIGSSIFRQWTNVAEHMAPLPTFNRAFGGSRTWEVLHYMNEVVLPYRPSVIVYYCGSNDVNLGESAVAIAGRFREFAERVHATLPDTRVLFVSINRAPQKRARWGVVDAANALVRGYADSVAFVDYVDVNQALFDARGAPRGELYRPDSLHFVPAAYDEFARIIKPVVTRLWEERR
jgi:lysophospholipase L1-like esterase